MHGIGKLGDMNRQMVQNKALLGNRRSFENIHGIFSKKPYQLELYGNEKKFTTLEIELAKEKARIEGKRERIKNYINMAIITIATILIMAIWVA